MRPASIFLIIQLSNSRAVMIVYQIVQLKSAKKYI